jgi:MOSC domain-containing protein YiiM
MTSRILSVNCGKVAAFCQHEASAIGKRPEAGNVRVTWLGLDGDEQADLRVHGGPDKAIHHYPAEHYAWWREVLGAEPLLERSGAFGENVSTDALTEMDVCIGDLWRMGTALVEVSQGRQPCWKLDHRFNGAAVMTHMVRSRRCGWYYRVVEEGAVGAGDLLTLVERPYDGWTVAYVFGLLIGGDHRRDRAGLEALGTVEALAAPWRQRRAALLGE